MSLEQLIKRDDGVQNGGSGTDRRLPTPSLDPDSRLAQRLNELDDDGLDDDGLDDDGLDDDGLDDDGLDDDGLDDDGLDGKDEVDPDDEEVVRQLVNAETTPATTTGEVEVIEDEITFSFDDELALREARRRELREARLRNSPPSRNPQPTLPAVRQGMPSRPMRENPANQNTPISPDNALTQSHGAELDTALKRSLAEYLGDSPLARLVAGFIEARNIGQIVLDQLQYSQTMYRYEKLADLYRQIHGTLPEDPTEAWDTLTEFSRVHNRIRIEDEQAEKARAMLVAQQSVFENLTAVARGGISHLFSTEDQRRAAKTLRNLALGAELRNRYQNTQEIEEVLRVAGLIADKGLKDEQTTRFELDIEEARKEAQIKGIKAHATREERQTLSRTDVDRATDIGESIGGFTAGIFGGFAERLAASANSSSGNITKTIGSFVNRERATDIGLVTLSTGAALIYLTEVYAYSGLASTAVGLGLGIILVGIKNSIVNAEKPRLRRGAPTASGEPDTVRNPHRAPTNSGTTQPQPPSFRMPSHPIVHEESPTPPPRVRPSNSPVPPQNNARLRQRPPGTTGGARQNLDDIL